MAKKKDQADVPVDTELEPTSLTPSIDDPADRGAVDEGQQPAPSDEAELSPEAPGDQETPEAATETREEKVAPEVTPESEVAPEASSAEPVAAPEQRPHYRGKLIINHGFREVQDMQLHHIRTADGQEFDLTDEEYGDQVTLS